MKITKAAWVWPFQRCMRFSVQPHDYAMNLQAMTKEKLQFLLPVVFTVGPDVNQRGPGSTHPAGQDSHYSGAHSDGTPAGDDHVHERRDNLGDSLMKYAMLLADSGTNKGGNHQFLEGIVKGIIEGETRVLVSSMTMEEIFTEREVFKRRIFRNIQSELDQFGLKIYKYVPRLRYFHPVVLTPTQCQRQGAQGCAQLDLLRVPQPQGARGRDQPSPH